MDVIHVDSTTGWIVAGALCIIGARMGWRRWQQVRAVRRWWAGRGA